MKGSWGMSGAESSPASLFQLYVDYGRYPEATNLLLHYIESLASLVCNVFSFYYSFNQLLLSVGFKIQ